MWNEITSPQRGLIESYPVGGNLLSGSEFRGHPIESGYHSRAAAGNALNCTVYSMQLITRDEVPFGIVAYSVENRSTVVGDGGWQEKSVRQNLP